MNKIKSPLPRAAFQNISCQKLPEDDLLNKLKNHRMSFNESPLGPSPNAIKAYQEAGDYLFRYPEGYSSSLSRELGKHYSLDPERIICGNGSEAIIEKAAFAYLEKDDEVIITQYAYYLYEEVTNFMGAIPVIVPEENYTVSVDNILKAITEKTKIIFFANPGNPTGTQLPKSEIIKLLKSIPSEILIIIDMAYAEYVEELEEIFDLSEQYKNLLITRSFSKIYGLAGLRVGWSYSSATISKTLRYVDGGYSVSRPAQEAAKAALVDQEYINNVRKHNQKWLLNLSDFLNQQGINYIPSCGNFMTLIFSSEQEAARITSKLKQKNIIVNELEAYDIPGGIRITISTKAQNLELINVLQNIGL